MPITALPTPPSRDDPTNFADEADAFLSALPTFATEANALQADVNSKQSQAAASEAVAVASAAAATAATGVIAWVSGTTYAVGNNRFDTTNFLTYRRKTAGAGTTRPGLDPTNWQLITGQGDAVLGGTQTFTGDNTFSGVATFSNGIVAPNAVTVGSIIILPLNSVPSGYLKCDGTAVSRTTYAALFAYLGTFFGVGNGSTTFNVPDYRGMFLRSLDEGRGIDVGRLIGTFQNSANLSHTHVMDAVPPHSHSSGTSGFFMLNTGPYGTGSIGSMDAVSSTASGGGHTPVAQASGGSESRPTNYSVIYAIKT